MVLATACVPRKNAIKLKKAANITARTGESTRVETTVAMELAASWNPLVKSKSRAMATIIATIAYVEFMKTSAWGTLRLCRFQEKEFQPRMSTNLFLDLMIHCSPPFLPPFVNIRG